VCRVDGEIAPRFSSQTMGKSKWKSSGGVSGGKGGGANKNKCTCDHPYICSCGNRPERPSKGHKWDAEAQTWGGKGHKQKGASGQIASVSQQATTTSVGRTQIQQWQRLPSQLLLEQCQKLKRPRPKYKNIENKPNLYKYRTILPDPKQDADKDLFFVPQQAVENEEQAKEECCLLALWHLAPKLPHERWLPEPYKTTWLNLIKSASASSQSDKKKQKPGSASRGSSPTPSSSSRSGGAPAKASHTLSMNAAFTSRAEKRRHYDEKQRARNARIRRHEAVRMANQNHHVVMTAKLRKQIECLLRGEGNFDLDDDDGDREDDPAVADDDDLDDVQVYVEERLHHEGFTRRQARTAYQEHDKSLGNKTISEDEWDGVYENCLQWLLVHLNEDQLPVGYDDPQGKLFDVIAPPSVSKSNDDVRNLASRYGISVQDVAVIRRKQQEHAFTKDTGSKPDFENTFWELLVSEAGVVLNEVDETGTCDEEGNRQALQEEVEALEAIFASECHVSTQNGETTVTIHLSESELSLKCVVEDSAYPSKKRPTRVFVHGQWGTSSTGAGVALHAELIRFMAGLELGEPMVFEIHSHVQSLLQSLDELPRMSLRSTASISSGNSSNEWSLETPASTEKKAKTQSSRSPIRRPRERGYFSLAPKNTPPATPFPQLDYLIEKSRKSLPAAHARREFLAALGKAKTSGGRVLLVTGDTGCGKTTQIPAFILEENPSTAKIVVAQPRRLAATGVASRVATERGESAPGVGSVGYVVRGDSAMSKQCRLLFCTTGVLLRQMQNEGALSSISHVVVDECHERHLDTDILLGLLKQGLAANPHLCVVLMSATLDADRFAAYWGNTTPRIHIPGRTFPVSDFFLEDVLSLTQYVPSKQKGTRASAGYGRDSAWDEDSEDDDPVDEPTYEDGSIDGISIADLVKRVDETSVDYNLLARLVKQLIAGKSEGDDGSILVFLPGAPEINKALETIKRYTKDLPTFLLPLHGGLQPKEQNAVFRPPPRGLTKVILCTNVAETSITIPDCTIVVDTARVKESSYDPANRMPLLVEQFASKASLQQRRGRAGRVREGTCYKLISRSTYSRLSEHGTPEISRCALDQTLLSLLFLGVERGSGTFMRTLLDPPSNESLRAAALNLEKVGAVEPGDEEGELRLTPLGTHLYVY